MSKVTELKDKFVEIYTENIKRPGSLYFLLVLLLFHIMLSSFPDCLPYFP